MTLPIGIMLGRLSRSRGRGLQFYPYEQGELENEFKVGHELGISHFEWVWDVSDNPLLDEDFRAKVRRLIEESQIPVIGADLQFLTKNDPGTITRDQFTRICEALADIDARAVDVPFLEDSSLLAEKPIMKKRLEHVALFLNIAEEFDLLLNLESDLPPKECKALLDVMPDLGICYDTGTSHALRYDIAEEWGAYGKNVRNVQISDRSKTGESVSLGTGGTDFHTIFSMMKQNGYGGPITLQAARGPEGQEVETIKTYMEFIEGHVKLL